MEWTKYNIMNLICTSKKYNNSNFIFEDDYVTYIIGDNKYKINILDQWSKITFSYSLYYENIKSIHVTITRNKCTAKKILSKFREVARNIEKLNVILTNKKLHTEKIKPVIKKYIMDEYSVELDFTKKENFNFRLNLPNTSFYSRHRSRSSSFDVTKEKPNKVWYKVALAFREGRCMYTFYFTFDSEKKKLSLEKREEEYNDCSKDVTKIIRSEKLKKLMLQNEEVN